MPKRARMAPPEAHAARAELVELRVSPAAKELRDGVVSEAEVEEMAELVEGLTGLRVDAHAHRPAVVPRRQRPPERPCLVGRTLRLPKTKGQDALRISAGGTY